MHLILDQKYYENHGIKVAMFVANNVVNDSRVLKTAQTLKKLGYQITVFGLSQNGDSEIIRRYNFPIKTSINPTAILKQDKRWYKLATWDKWDTFSEMAAACLHEALIEGDFDILHTHDMVGMTVGGKLQERHQDRPYKWIHDIHEYVEGLTEIDDDVRQFYMAQELKYITHPDALTTVSPVLADILQSNFTLETAPIVILNAPRASDFDPHAFDIRSKIGLDEKKPLFCYVGNAKEVRGIHHIIDALDTFNDAHLVIVTNSQNDYRKSLEDQVDRLNLTQRVHFLPYVPFHDVTSLLRSATIGIHPINSYPNSEVALPNKLFEYLHAGIPIISSDVAAMKSFIEQYDCGSTFKNGNPESLASALQAVFKRLQDSPDWTSHFKDIAADYCWETQEQKLSEIYDKLTQDCRRTASKTDSNSRILHLPTTNAGQPYNLSSALRERGHSSNALSLSTNPLGYKSDLTLETATTTNELLNSFSSIMNRFDILHYHALPLIFKKKMSGLTGIDLFLARLNGKQIFYHFRGSEIRMKSVFEASSKYHYTKEAPDIFHDFPEEHQKRYVDLALALSDQVLAVDPEIQSYVPQSVILPRVINTSDYKPKDHANDKIKIIHAPSRRHVKGTKAIETAIKTLKSEGYDIDFTLIQNMKNDDALAHYQKADIIIDQLRIGWYGVLSVEAMALGKPVISFIRADIKHHLPVPAPIANANPDNLLSVLRSLIENEEERIALSKRGRSYVEAMHDINIVAQNAEYIYNMPRRKLKATDLLCIIEEISKPISKKHNTLYSIKQNLTGLMAKLIGSYYAIGTKKTLIKVLKTLVKSLLK